MKVFKCGLRMRGINWTWPFGKITINENSILIQTPLSKYDLEFANLEKASEHNGIFSTGIKLITFQTMIPREIIIWTGNDELIQSIGNIIKGNQHSDA